MKKRDRGININLWVSAEEKALIEKKMAMVPTDNMSAYIRKMAIDGYILNVDLSCIQELVSLLRASSNNMNQIAKRANETRSIYEQDIIDLKKRQGELWVVVNSILSKFQNL